MSYGDALIKLTAKVKGTGFKPVGATWLGDDGDYTTAVWDFKSSGRHPQKFSASYAQMMNLATPAPKGSALYAIFAPFAVAA